MVRRCARPVIFRMGCCCSRFPSALSLSQSYRLDKLLPPATVSRNIIAERVARERERGGGERRIAVLPSRGALGARRRDRFERGKRVRCVSSRRPEVENANLLHVNLEAFERRFLFARFNSRDESTVEKLIFERVTNVSVFFFPPPNRSSPRKRLYPDVNSLYTLIIMT